MTHILWLINNDFWVLENNSEYDSYAMTHSFQSFFMNNPFQSNRPNRPFCQWRHNWYGSCTKPSSPRRFHVLVHSPYWHLVHFRHQFWPKTMICVLLSVTKCILCQNFIENKRENVFRRSGNPNLGQFDPKNGQKNNLNFQPIRAQHYI